MSCESEEFRRRIRHFAAACWVSLESQYFQPATKVQTKINFLPLEKLLLYPQIEGGETHLSKFFCKWQIYRHTLSITTKKGSPFSPSKLQLHIGALCIDNGGPTASTRATNKQ
jgi:hypothetical protein